MHYLEGKRLYCTKVSILFHQADFPWRVSWVITAGVEYRGAGVQAHPPFDLVKIRAKSLKIRAKKILQNPDKISENLHKLPESMSKNSAQHALI